MTTRAIQSLLLCVTVSAAACAKSGEMPKSDESAADTGAMPGMPGKGWETRP